MTVKYVPTDNETQIGCRFATAPICRNIPASHFIIRVKTAARCRGHSTTLFREDQGAAGRRVEASRAHEYM